MDAIEFEIQAANRAITNLYAAARKMSDEQLRWSPLELGRTALSQLQECAMAPVLQSTMMAPETRANPDPKLFRKLMVEGGRLKTLEECEAATHANTARWAETLRSLSEEDLQAVVSTPWGEELPVSAIATMHAWNMIYHLGQINYIQTLYGDTSKS